MVRTGIIGTGLIAHTNYRGLARTGRCEVVGLCNRTHQKGVDFAREYGLGCPVFSDYRELYERTRPEAVLINTPHDAHEEVFIYYAERGVNIMVEKPLADNSQACLAMIKAARAGGIRAGMCHTQRYGAEIMTAREFISTHDLGELISYVDSGCYNYFWEGRPLWFLDPSRAGGGIVMNYGVHALDRMHFLSPDKTTRLTAHIETRKPDVLVDSSYHILGETRGGTTYMLNYSGYSNPFSNCVEMRFLRGVVKIALFDDGMVKKGAYYGDNDNNFTLLPNVCSDDGEERTLRQMNALMDCMEGKPGEWVTLEHGAEMVRLVELAVKADAEGCWLEHDWPESL